MCNCLLFLYIVYRVGMSTLPPWRILFNPPSCPIRYIGRPLYPALPSFLARSSAGVYAIWFSCQAARRGAATQPSFPVLMHQATQIFSPNPFLTAPLPPHPHLFFFFPLALLSLLKFGNTIWRDDGILIPSNITGSRVSCRLGALIK